jgi:hypothetical protein
VRTPRFRYTPGAIAKGIEVIIHNFKIYLKGRHAITSEQAFVWLESYPAEIIEDSLRVTGGWYERHTQKGTTFTDDQIGAYASAVMRNKYESKLRYEEAMRSKVANDEVY